MEERTLNYIADACGGRLTEGAADAVVSGVSTDSRTASGREVFIAIKGERFDAHEFVPTLMHRGVAGVVVHGETPLETSGSTTGVIRVDDTRAALGRLAARYRCDFELPVIAVAGSNGKTSTKELLASVLRQRFPVLWSRASFNNDIGVPLTLLRLERAHRAAVLEVGTNHPGELDPLIRIIDPQIGVLTSIGREHLEFFGDIDGVIKEEGTLAELLPADGMLFINGDCEHAQAIIDRTSATVVKAGLGTGNAWCARKVRFDDGWNRFELVSPDGRHDGPVEMRLLGRVQVNNALLAAAVGAHLGLDFEQIAHGLRECAPAGMRMELMEFGGVRVLNDAYNANADSTRVALVTMAEMPVEGRRIVVLGDMAELGEHAHAAHLEMGRLAAELKVDQLIATGRHAAATVCGATDAGLREALVVDTVEAVGRRIRTVAAPGDLVLLKGSRAGRLERVAEYLATGEARPT